MCREKRSGISVNLKCQKTFNWLFLFLRVSVMNSKKKNYSATSLPVSGADRLVNRPNDVTDLLCDLEAIIICKDSCCDNLVPVLTELARFF